jgi:dTDP-glucose 4,6-dehydratase
MQSYLVTGGAGFIGSNFARMILAEFPDVRVTILDKLTYAGNPENISDLMDNPNLSFVQGDICDADIVDELMPGQDAVINFAAETHVDRSIGDPSGFVKTDVIGTYVLLESARVNKVGRFMQISTDEVYGDALGEPSTEDSPLMPRSPYAASKAGADRLAFSYWATYSYPVIITRCVNNYGPYQHPEKMIPLFVTNAIEGKPLPVYGSGENTREWIHVLDHCRALKMLLDDERSFGNVYNVGTGRELSILDFAHSILEILGKDESLINHVTDRPGHVMRHAVDSTRLREEFNWRPQMEFENGFRETVEWYVENSDWWEKIKSGEFRKYYKEMYAKRGRWKADVEK